MSADSLRLSAPGTLKRSGKQIVDAFGVKYRCSGEQYQVRYAPASAIFSEIALLRYPVSGARNAAATLLPAREREREQRRHACSGESHYFHQ
jgi:hypothetical protein